MNAGPGQRTKQAALRDITCPAKGSSAELRFVRHDAPDKQRNRFTTGIRRHIGLEDITLSSLGHAAGGHHEQKQAGCGSLVHAMKAIGGEILDTPDEAHQHPDSH